MSPTFLAYLVPVLSFAAYVGVGIVLRCTHVLGQGDSKVINNVIVNVSLPAFIFAAVYESGFSFDALKAVGAGWVVMLAMLLITYPLCRLMKLDRKMTGSVMLCAVWANTGFMGYPLTTAIFGSTYLVESVFMDLFVSVLSLFTIGVALASRFGDAGGGRTNPLLELVKLPQLWALAAALICKQLTLPDQVLSWVTALGNVSSPLIMVSVGLSMGRPDLKNNAAAGIAAVVLKLAVAPLIAFFVGSLLLSSQTSVQVAMLEMGCPTMMLCMVVAQRFGLDEGFVARIVFVSVLACIITIPLAQAFLFA